MMSLQLCTYCAHNLYLYIFFVSCDIYWPLFIHVCTYTQFLYLFVLFVSLFTCHPVVILCHDRPTREWKVHRSQSKGSEGLGVEFMVSFFQTFPTQKEVSSELLYGVFFSFLWGGGSFGVKTRELTRWICQ